MSFSLSSIATCCSSLHFEHSCSFFGNGLNPASFALLLPPLALLLLLLLLLRATCTDLLQRAAAAPGLAKGLGPLHCS
jgi:hypothetical protein